MNLPEGYSLYSAQDIPEIGGGRIVEIYLRFPSGRCYMDYMLQRKGETSEEFSERLKRDDGWCDRVIKAYQYKPFYLGTSDNPPKYKKLWR